jgi:hypothetical protein
MANKEFGPANLRRTTSHIEITALKKPVHDKVDQPLHPDAAAFSLPTSRTEMISLISTNYPKAHFYPWNS